MPIDYKEYPPNWKTEIRPAVMARAGELRDDGGNIIKHACCENPDCKVENHSKGARDFRGIWLTESEINGLDSTSGEWHFQHIRGFPKITMIVLTVAHLDHDKTNKEISIDRLRAWCQRCHLNFDRDHHIKNRKDNRNKKKGVQLLF